MTYSHRSFIIPIFCSVAQQNFADFDAFGINNNASAPFIASFPNQQQQSFPNQQPQQSFVEQQQQPSLLEQQQQQQAASDR